jgi:hypothetical protein
MIAVRLGVCERPVHQSMNREAIFHAERVRKERPQATHAESSDRILDVRQQGSAHAQRVDSHRKQQ